MNFKATADALDATATAMENDPTLNVDHAARKAIWGTPNAHVPTGHTTESILYDDVTISIAERYDQQHGITNNPTGPDGIGRDDAINAARAEAAYLRGTPS